MVATTDGTDRGKGRDGVPSLCIGPCDEVADVEYGKIVYMLLHDKGSGRWIFRDLMSNREFIVYTGDIHVERIRDKSLGETAIIIRSENAEVFGFEIDDVIEQFLNKEPRAINERYIRSFLRALIRESAVKDGYVVSGFYADGYVDGLIPYPATSWECEPSDVGYALSEMAKYVKETYPPSNRAVALANVPLGIAKVLSPAIRLAGRRVYEDRVVINVGRKRVGKTTLFKSVINLLGLRPDSVLFGGDLVVKTPERVRNLLMRSNAPLFLDDVGPKGFEALTNIILPATVDGIVIGIQAERYGYGIASKFISLRSVTINTNLDVGTVSRVLSQYGNTAWTRRAIVLNWADAPLRPGVEPYSGKPILGCIRELWDKNHHFRGFVIDRVNDIVELALQVMDALHRAYSVDTSVYKEYKETVRTVMEAAEGVEDVVETRYSPEYQVVARMYEIARQALGATNISVYQVLKAMVENPGRFDVRVTGSREQEAIERDLRDWEALVKALGFNPEDLTVAPDSEDGDLEQKLSDEKLSDVEKALAFVWWLIKNRKNRVIIHAGSSDGAYPGWARELFNAKLGKYGNRYGYSISWVELLRYMLNATDVETVETEKPTESTKNTEEATVDLYKQ